MSGGKQMSQTLTKYPKTFGKRTFLQMKNAFIRKATWLPKKVAALFREDTWKGLYGSLKRFLMRNSDEVLENKPPRDLRNDPVNVNERQPTNKNTNKRTDQDDVTKMLEDLRNSGNKSDEFVEALRNRNKPGNEAVAPPDEVRPHDAPEPKRNQPDEEGPDNKKQRDNDEAEKMAALGEAKALLALANATNEPLLALQTQLTAVDAQYDAVKRFEYVPKGSNTEIWMIGSRYFVGTELGEVEHDDGTKTPVTKSVYDTDTIDDQVQLLTENVQGLSSDQAKFLIENVSSRGGSFVIGGSRVRGNAKIVNGEVVSDLDVGFIDLSQGQINKVKNKFNKAFTGESQGEKQIIEHNFIYPGSTPQNIPKIISPEEFFMRSGFRSIEEGGAPYNSSGYIKVYPNGRIEIGR